MDKQFVVNKMGILNHTKTYLVGNLESTEDGHNWRIKREEDLNKLGVTCFNPNKNHFLNQVTETDEDRENLKRERALGNFSYVSNYMKNVIRRDLRFVDVSDFIIGHIEPDKPTWGTTHEIIMSSIQRKPIILTINDKRKFPLWLCGLIDTDYIFEKWSDALTYLKKVDSGEIIPDPKYWKLFKI